LETQSHIWQVSELNHAARALLERHFGSLTVCGEISAFTRARSGHWYFTLKDLEGQVSCAMFRNRNLYCQFEPKIGDLVHLQAKVSIYPGRGDYQLIVEALTPAGEGRLQIAFQQLKLRLENEGLFAPERKRPIPEHCRRVAVITSADGAAVHDFITVAGKRMPGLVIDILPVPVQGADAAAASCRAIELCNQVGMHDVIVLTRGGGSMEDLWSYNDETLARYIANSAIPVISAVGHETDFTIADFVADLRTPTPSAAAEAVTQDQSHLLQYTQQLGRRLHQSALQTITKLRLNTEQLAAKIHNPQTKLQDVNQRLDKLNMRLEQAQDQNLAHRRQYIERLLGQLQQRSPEKQIPVLQQRIENLQQRASQQLLLKQRLSKDKLANLANSLHQLSPLQTLTRGYSITQNVEGKVITNAKQVTSGEAINIRLDDGSIAATVD
jgi:exodeoxyribonuclease VII large subunit